MSLNPRLLAILTLMGILACIMFPSQIYHTIISPFTEKTKTDIAISCITETLKENPQMVENIQNHPEIITALQKNNYTAIIKEVPVYITITPTPDGITYYAGEYQNGTRLLAHPFSWYRTNINLPNNSLKISANVYDYRIFPRFYYKNLDYSNSLNGIYTEQNPDNPNDEFIFIMTNIYADDTISSKTPNMWLPTQNSFSLGIKGNTYYPVKYPHQLQIKEMEELTNQGNNYFIKPYGYTIQYEKTHSNHNELYNNGTAIEYTSNGIAGITARSLSYVPKGSSNMIDGYILFEIPKDTPLETITIMANFFSFGHAEWKLINQNSEGFINPYITQTQY